MKLNTDFPQGKIIKIQGNCLVLKGNDIDTDRIIPARFLKCVSFENLGEQVFADDRKELKGNHPFDDSNNKGASILIVNGNFGCGSSREHAPQALMRWGIRGLIGESFAEIFYGNCLALGIPCVTASKINLEEIQSAIEKKASDKYIIDLEKETFQNYNNEWKVSIEVGPKQMLISGQWDATSQLISNHHKLLKLHDQLPYLENFNN